ncbi:hypothetical protein [Streptomyces sp. KL110A]
MVYSEPSPVPGYGVVSSVLTEEPAVTAMPVFTAVAEVAPAPVNFIVTL